MSFVHLHRHSEWSLGDGTGTAEQYAERAVELGQPALAITDHGSLAGTLYHMQACEKAGIKPILGMEAYFRYDVEADREAKNPFGFFHLVLLAKNETGWKNLMRLSSRSHDDEHSYQKPCVDWKLLQDYASGLIATSSCLNGFIPKMYLADRQDQVRRHIDDMRGLFGDDFYFEVQPHAIPEQEAINMHVVALAKETGIPLVATTDVHSPYEDWTETQGIRTMIGYSQTIKDREESGEEYGGLATTYLMSEDELRQSFAEHHKVLNQDEIDEAVKTSLDIADKCDHIVVDKSPKIPHATKSLMEAERVLRGWCNEGLKRIGKENNQVYIDRMNEELATMRKLKVLDYFVVVGDMIRFAKSVGIRIGPARGSAGGSLICYLTKITALDPIGYDLLFERFLNEYRTEIPDIDFDIDPTRRHELKEYLVKRWGYDYVVDVSAFQSFGLKAAVKDVARALCVDYHKTNKATSLIPDLAFGETLESLEETLPGLKAYFDEEPEVRKHAVRLQGQIKGASKHAAAVIVTDVPAEDVIPMMRSKDGTRVTQWSERANGQLLSPYGFLKIDMLVTDALTSQARAIELIRDRHGVEIDFEDPKQFPVVESPNNSEREVIETFGSGRNLGIFQFASSGIGGLLKEIKPETLEHIIAANALYRPGTLTNGVAFDYAKRKNGLVEWKYPHPSVEPFLGKSYGLIVFQEQVMQMYRTLGENVESAESAVFLKVVAKGIARDLHGKEKLKAYYDKFASGCKEKGLSKSDTDEIWDAILAMTTYSFNRSHSAGYALQAYQDAYLKNHFTIEFYGPLLTTEENKTAQIIREAKSFDMKILPPDINKSEAEFTLDGDSIRFGLMAVKGIAWAGLNEIKTKRPFASLEDFEARVEKKKCNKKAKAALVECGAFDTLGERSEWTPENKARSEKEILGIALSVSNDISKYKDALAPYVMTPEQLIEAGEAEEDAFIAGEIVKMSEHKTRKGNPYIRADIDYDGELYHVTFWTPRYNHLLEEGNVIAVMGRYDVGRSNLSVDSCVTAEQLLELEE